MSRRPNLSATETAALLEEVAACLRAEIPLGIGLATLENGEAGRISSVVAEIRSALDGGVPVDQAVSQSMSNQNDRIGAALRIGLQAGNPGESLRRLASLIVMRREMKLRSIIAMIYPSIIILVSYFVLVAVFASVVDFNSNDFFWPPYVTSAASVVTNYWYVPPLFLLALFLLVRLTKRRSIVPGHWNPSCWSNQSLFCEAVAWQLESETPLPIAIRSAGGLVGGHQLCADAESWANAIERGERVPAVGSSFRPLVIWTISNAIPFDGNAHPTEDRLIMKPVSHERSSNETVASSLRRLAQTYRDAERRSWHLLTRWIPVTVTSVVGGSMAIAYLCVVVWPLYHKLAEVQF